MELRYTKNSDYGVYDYYMEKVDLTPYLTENWREIINKLPFIDYIEATKSLIALHGFDFDPSGPTINDETNIRASCGHDMLYKLIRWGVLTIKARKFADKHFNKVAKEDGMWWWRRKYWIWFLRKGAGFAAKPENKKTIYVVGQ